LMMVDSANRPISLVRCPQGRAKKCFFQKHDSGSFGPDIKHVPVKEKKGGTEDYLYIDDPKGLLTLVQMGTIEVHGWGSRVKPLEKPDRLVFDLDPDVDLDFGDVRSAAVRLKALLADLGLVSFPMVTGGKGLHVVVPLDASAAWPKVTDFAERFARAIAQAEPARFTANIRKVERKGRIFLDYLRNQRGATAILPYSARARDGAPVAAPIAWEELEDIKGGNIFTILDADLLLERASSKLLAGWGVAKQKLPKA
jgi:bifunctional non-homologous end joining protein LigD